MVWKIRTFWAGRRLFLVKALVVAGLLAVCLAAGQGRGPAADSESADPAATEPDARELLADEAREAGEGEPLRLLREGDLLSQTAGVFRVSGNRVTFAPTNDRRRFIVLENLNLERIARILENRPDTVEWQVTGTITEFQETNYLLVTHAIRNSRALLRGGASRTAEADGAAAAAETQAER